MGDAAIVSKIDEWLRYSTWRTYIYHNLLPIFFDFAMISPLSMSTLMNDFKDFLTKKDADDSLTVINCEIVK